MSGPLTGIRILDLTRLLPGGYCTQLLGDLGAEVIKIEEPGKGDYIRWSPPMIGNNSAAHWVLNRNKKSVTLNLKSPEGPPVLLKLAESADVVVEGFRPGVMDRLGVGYDEIRKVNPKIVYCSISGYGSSGPYVNVAGHDINYIGYAGVLGLNGFRRAQPVVPGVQVGDLGGGGMMPAIGILASVIRARETGEGDYVDIAMMDGAFSWLTISAANFLGGGGLPARGEDVLNGGVPCYSVYECADGEWLSVGALEPQFWQALCGVIERDDLSSKQFSRETFAELEAVFKTKSRSDWMNLFAGVDACVGPVNSLAESFEDPQILHREMVVNQEHPTDGTHPNIGVPIKLREAPGAVRSPAPDLGEHTDVVLAAAGYGDEAIADLRASGAL